MLLLLMNINCIGHSLKESSQAEKGHKIYEITKQEKDEETRIKDKTRPTRRLEIETEGKRSKTKNFVVEFNQINWPVGGLFSISTDILLHKKGHNLHLEFFLYHDPSLLGRVTGLSSRKKFEVNGRGGLIGYKWFNGETGMDGWFWGVGGLFVIFEPNFFNSKYSGRSWIGVRFERGYRFILQNAITLSISSGSGIMVFEPKGLHNAAFLMPWADFKFSVGIAF